MRVSTWRRADYWTLLAGVMADPDNPLPRLVLADFMDDCGEADAAEFVRVGVAMHANTRAGQQFTSQAMKVSGRFAQLLGSRAGYQSWNAGHRRRDLMPMWGGRGDSVLRWEWQFGMCWSAELWQATDHSSPPWDQGVESLARLVRCQPIRFASVNGCYAFEEAFAERRNEYPLRLFRTEAAMARATQGVRDRPWWSVIPHNGVWMRLEGGRRVGPDEYRYRDHETAASGVSAALIDEAWETDPFGGTVPRPTWLPWTFPRTRPEAVK